MLKLAWLFLWASLALAESQTPECLKDSDCVLRPVNCCKCNQGGKLKAAPRNKPRPDCRDRLCPQVMSQDKSCTVKKAICRAGKCELGPMAMP